MKGITERRGGSPGIFELIVDKLYYTAYNIENKVIL